MMLSPSAERSMNILVVDDERALLDELLEHLALQGYSAVGAGDVDGAIDILEQETAHTALLTDIRLPGRSGLELIRFVHGRPDLRSRVDPILIMTGHTEILDQFGREHQDEIAVLPKPIDLALLDRLLRADSG
jgi:DNA-binding NtrC family response regulator